MTFKEALKIILEQRGHGNKKNNLAEVKKTAAALGLKNLNFKTVIVTGTNGKGTTATLLAAALSAGGHKTGLFTSPHIYEVTERIKIDGAEISKKDFAFYVNAVLKAETAPLKFFEVLTLAAMLYFKDNNVDFAVLEVGIGGRLDCTNIFPRVLSIITSVDIDHAAILGGTLAKIAWQKGGIIKRGAPCVAGPLAPQAKTVINKIAKAEQSKILTLGKEFKIEGVNYKTRKTAFSFGKDKYQLNLLGAAQAQNAALVCLAAGELGIKPQALARAFATITMPCRFEVLPFAKRFVIKDGAHNPAAVGEFLKTYLSSPYCKGENTLIYSAMEGKDYQTALNTLALYFKHIILTCADNKKGVSAQQLKACLKVGGAQVKTYKNPALIPLKNCIGNIIIAGSFYLCAKIRKIPS